MARKSNYIGTTETGNLSALGNAQQRDYNFVKNLLSRNDLIKYFAEPSVRENQEKIDWYSETRGKVIGFQDFNKEQVQRARTELNHVIRELSHVASSAENQVDRQAIENLSVLPDTDSIKMVGDQITIINWAYRLHKRAKGDRQSSNFAGFGGADPNIEEIIENNDDAIAVAIGQFLLTQKTALMQQRGTNSVLLELGKCYEKTKNIEAISALSDRYPIGICEACFEWERYRATFLFEQGKVPADSLQSLLEFESTLTNTSS